MTVRDLLDSWLNDVCMSLREHTYRDYVNYSRYIIRYIGDVDVSTLTSAVVRAFYSSLYDEFNAATVLHCNSVFRIAVNYGIDNCYLVKNPLKGVKLPKSQHYSPTFLGAAELKRLLRCADDYGIYNAVLLAGCLGLRRGECLALCRSDVDVARHVINISRSAEWNNGERILSSLKTRSSYRSLLVSDKFIDSLFAHSDSDFFCDYSQSVLQRRFAALLLDNDFPCMRFHDLRHTFASISVLNGVNFKVLQNRLGHSSIRMTLDIYSHLDTAAQSDSASLFDDYI